MLPFRRSARIANTPPLPVEKPPPRCRRRGPRPSPFEPFRPPRAGRGARHDRLEGRIAPGRHARRQGVRRLRRRAGARLHRRLGRGDERPHADRPGTPDPARPRHRAGAGGPPHRADLRCRRGWSAASLYAPADFFEKILFPLAGAAGTYDAAKRVWTLSAAGPPPALDRGRRRPRRADDPGRAAALGGREDGDRARPRGASRSASRTRRSIRPFPRRSSTTPSWPPCASAGDTATVEFREPNLTARAYPLTAPDRIVIEVGRRTAAAGGSRRAGRARRPAHPAADDRRRPRARRRRDRRHRAGRSPGKGGHARDREEARRHAAEGPPLPHGADARHGRPDPARRPRPRSRTTRRRTCSSRSTPTPRAPPRRRARRRTTSRSRPPTRSPRKSRRRKTRRRGAAAPGAGGCDAATTTSTSSSGTSPRART